jgi:hypothetical protein
LLVLAKRLVFSYQDLLISWGIGGSILSTIRSVIGALLDLAGSYSVIRFAFHIQILPDLAPAGFAIEEIC